MMRIWATLITLFYSINIINAKYSVVFLYFGDCNPGENNTVFQFRNNQWGMITSDISELNTTIVFLQDMDKVDAKALVYKCKSESEADCEVWMKVDVKDVCHRITEKGQFYSLIADVAQPPMTCPFKKGTYVANHARINLNLVHRLMEENLVYLLKFPGLWRGKYTGCLMVKAKKVNLKNKKKT